MATEFKLPDLGENIASGDVVTVFVSAGDVLKPGQPLLEVETDKAVIEVPCPPGGRVVSVLVKKG
ncbi:MAG: branched-chain alpha-keto acid dehydrogenase subunit E2, partial [Planctomycetia bacterium]|nr:branched-chain alpha-keto acid dehydrogenase subunit E2 [Planctomycetia bacterium]